MNDNEVVDSSLSDTEYDKFLENYMPNTKSTKNNVGYKITIFILSAVIVILLGVICLISVKKQSIPTNTINTTAKDIISYLDKEEKQNLIDTEYQLYTELQDTTKNTSKVLYDYIQSRKQESLTFCKNFINFYFADSAYTNADYEELAELYYDTEYDEFYEKYEYVALYGTFVKELESFTKQNVEVKCYLFQDVVDNEPRYYKVYLCDSYINLNRCANKLVFLFGYVLPATSYKEAEKVPTLFSDGMIDVSIFEVVQFLDGFELDEGDCYDILLEEN